MASLDSIKKFFSNKNIAVVGVSSTGKGFGYLLYHDLLKSGFNVFPVNNKTDNIDGNICYNSLLDLKGKVEAVAMIIPPSEGMDVLAQASEIGIKDIWFQPGAESRELLSLANDLGMNVISGECLKMFAEPVTGFHRFHRGFVKLVGKYPKV